MRPSTTLIAFLAPLGIFANVEVRFFSDRNCKDYLGSTFGTSYGIGGGGPPGSFSAYYAEGPTCIRNKGCTKWKASENGDEQVANGCFGSPTGVWVSASCGLC